MTIPWYLLVAIGTGAVLVGGVLATLGWGIQQAQETKAALEANIATDRAERRARMLQAVAAETEINILTAQSQVIERRLTLAQGSSPQLPRMQTSALSAGIGSTLFSSANDAELFNSMVEMQQRLDLFNANVERSMTEILVRGDPNAVLGKIRNLPFRKETISQLWTFAHRLREEGAQIRGPTDQVVGDGQQQTYGVEVVKPVPPSWRKGKSNLGEYVAVTVRLKNRGPMNLGVQVEKSSIQGYPVLPIALVDITPKVLEGRAETEVRVSAYIAAPAEIQASAVIVTDEFGAPIAELPLVAAPNVVTGYEIQEWDDKAMRRAGRLSNSGLTIGTWRNVYPMVAIPTDNNQRSTRFEVEVRNGSNGAHSVGWIEFADGGGAAPTQVDSAKVSQEVIPPHQTRWLDVELRFRTIPKQPTTTLLRFMDKDGLLIGELSRSTEFFNNKQADRATIGLQRPGPRIAQ